MTKTTKNNNNNTRLTASFWDKLGKPVPDGQTIRELNAATDNGRGGSDNQNS